MAREGKKQSPKEHLCIHKAESVITLRGTRMKWRRNHDPYKDNPSVLQTVKDLGSICTFLSCSEVFLDFNISARIRSE